jgi:hypothetical protein
MRVGWMFSLRGTQCYIHELDRQTDRHALMEIVCVIGILQMARQRQTTTNHFSLFFFTLSFICSRFVLLIFLSFVFIFVLIVLPHASIFFPLKAFCFDSKLPVGVEVATAYRFIIFASHR